ncbi:MAG TPA: PIG-L family deacetylase [Marmoricola sp.]|nr:PIG-L family deacetylase [Marmoricola sp.]
MPTTVTGPDPLRTDALPPWPSVLAVVAHPDDESFGLGAILDAFSRAGAEVTVLCLTHGEASTIHGVTGELATLRESELREAARALGVSAALLCTYADGALAGQLDRLTTEITDVLEQRRATGLIVFDPSGVTGHPDHAAATAAALRAAEARDLPVLGWTLPQPVASRLNEELDLSFTGHPADAVDLVVGVDRERQRIASLAHASQAVPTSVLWRRLELLGDVEYLRWLRRPATDQATMPSKEKEHTVEDQAQVETMRVDWRSGDRFDIAIRDHVVTVDQPEAVGGEDVAPTPTELFVAGLVSCVAFYARRYLRRHHLDQEGLVVEASYRMGAKPARVSDIDIRIHPPAGLPEERRDAMLAVATHCTVHNSITTAPEINVSYA